MVILLHSLLSGKIMLKIILILYIFLSSAQAEALKLLDIPLADKTFFTYSVNINEECSFHGVNDVHISSFDPAQKSNLILDKINYFQKKLNLSIDEKEITDERITFSLNGSTNISFEFFFKKSLNHPELQSS